MKGNDVRRSRWYMRTVVTCVLGVGTSVAMLSRIAATNCLETLFTLDILWAKRTETATLFALEIRRMVPRAECGWRWSGSSHRNRAHAGS